MNFYEDIRDMLGEFSSDKAPNVRQNLEIFKQVGECYIDIDGISEELARTEEASIGEYTRMYSKDATIEIAKIESQIEDLISGFITSNLRLITSALIAFLNRHPQARYLKDDLFSAGLLQITYATHFLKRKLKEDRDSFWDRSGVINGDGNLGLIVYLYISICREIQRTYELDAVKPIGERLYKKFTPIGKDKPLKKIDVEDWVFEAMSYDPFKEIFFYDDIMELCQTEEERIIIALAITKSYRKIADEIGRSLKYVLSVKNRIYRRFCNSLEQPE